MKPAWFNVTYRRLSHGAGELFLAKCSLPCSLLLNYGLLGMLNFAPLIHSSSQPNESNSVWACCVPSSQIRTNWFHFSSPSLYTEIFTNYKSRSGLGTLPQWQRRIVYWWCRLWKRTLILSNCLHANNIYSTATGICIKSTLSIFFFLWKLR